MFYFIFKLLTKRAKIALFLMAVLTLVFAVFVPRLEIDASSETLMLNSDKDLDFARKMSKRFNAGDFLVVTYTPKSPMLSKSSINTLKSLTQKLQKVPEVSSVLSILNVPLFQSPPRPLKELLGALPTVLSKDTNLTLAKKEFLSSPLYKNNLVSSNFKTSAILLNLKRDDKYFKLLYERNALLVKKNDNNITQNELKNLEALQKEFKEYREFLRVKEHNNLQLIRQILDEHKLNSKMFLGGVSMIADDMINYVKGDIILYGVSLFLLLVLTLSVIFCQIRWVVIPLLICAVSVVITSGLLGYLGLEITVISSNFISLQLIITLSIALHLIVQYQEYAKRYPKVRQKTLVFATLLNKAKPSFFAIITTIAGFASLVFSNIKPIINLGIMMSIAISISLIVSFVLFASINSLLPKRLPKKHIKAKYSIVNLSANIVQKQPKTIVVVAILAIVISFIGSSKLEVENSFINYFKSSTEIYKGMEVIDKQLGGTTPLDLIVTFKEKKEDTKSLDDEFGSFEDEFNEQSSEPKYWFTYPKISLIQKLHSYLASQKDIGNVQSFDTMLKIGKILNNNEPLDSFLIALIYEQMPERFEHIILDPYVNIQHNQVRFNTRIVDSSPTLRRNELIKKINTDLSKIVPKDEADFRLSSFMILYNNMLQSLYTSQIKTLGFVVLLLLAMFWVLFRSLKVALIAIASNLIPIGLLFGFMGLAGISLDMMSITIAAISIGIGVDDTIHYIHRFKHEYSHTHDYKQAMLNTHRSTGYAMFYTTFSIVLGFSVLVVSNFIPTIYFGLLTDFVMIMCLASALVLLPRMILIFKPFSL